MSNAVHRKYVDFDGVVYFIREGHKGRKDRRRVYRRAKRKADREALRLGMADYYDALSALEELEAEINAEYDYFEFLEDEYEYEYERSLEWEDEDRYYREMEYLAPYDPYDDYYWFE